MANPPLSGDAVANEVRIPLAKVKNGESEAEYDGHEKEEVQDQIINAIGNFGRWQLKHILLIFLVQLPTGLPILGITFMVAETDFWCARPEKYKDMDPSDWRTMSSPVITQGGKEICDQCRVWDTPDYIRPENDTTKACDSWEFDTSSYELTLLNDFDLVCDRDFWKNLHQTVYFTGLTLGVLVAGWMADIIGRKWTVIPVSFAMATFGLVSTFLPSIQLVITARFFQAFCNLGPYSITFVWVMEQLGGKKWPTIIGFMFFIPWVLDFFIVALVVYVTPNWRYTQMILMVPSFFCSAVMFLVPESPKWLLATGRIAEAEKIVKEIVQYNHKVLPEGWKLYPVTEGNKKSKASLLDLFSRPNMAMKTLILYYNWFAISFVYYGLTLNSGNLGGTIMINFLLNGLVEIPAYTFGMYVLLYLGRKIPFSGMMLVGGIALLFTMAVPRDVYTANWPAVALAMVGKLCITATFAIAYVYTAEINPTVVRSLGLGSASLFARISGMVAPFVGSLDKVVNPNFPICIFGLAAFVGAVFALFLPETQGRKLPDTVEEGEEIKIDFKDGIVARKKLY